MPNANKFKYDSACVVGLKDASIKLGATLQNSLMRRGIIQKNVLLILF
jgi:hypothetical protein